MHGIPDGDTKKVQVEFTENSLQRFFNAKNYPTCYG